MRGLKKLISQILIDFATETLSAAGSVGADQTTLALSPSASLNTITLNGVAHVAVNASARDGDGAALLAELSQLGLQQGAAYSDVVSGYLPATALTSVRLYPRPMPTILHREICPLASPF